LQLLILGGILLGFLDGLVDVVLGHVGGGGDGDVLLLAGAQILGGDVDDAVGVDVEGDLDLRHAAGAGAMPSSWKRPRDLLYCAISRSPCSTLTSTEVWLSAAVENTWLFLVGMVVLRSMSLVNTPPRSRCPGTAA
jgi:hypothetical protein